jgi:hypothetical protein
MDLQGHLLSMWCQQRVLTCGVQGLYEDSLSAEGSPAELVPRLPLAAAPPVDALYMGMPSVLPAGPVLLVSPAAVAAPIVGD